MTKRELALMHVHERNSLVNDILHEQTQQRKFERRMLSFDWFVEETQSLDDNICKDSVNLSDNGRSVRVMTRQIDWPTLKARRIACMNQAAAQLPRSSELLRQLLWAIFRNGRNRRETMSQLGISRITYWRGVKFFLKFFKAQ